MKILMLYNKEWLNTHMCRGDFHSIDAIIRHPDVESVKDGPNFKGWIDVPTSVKRHNPDLVLWHNPLTMKNFEQVGVPTVIRYHEMWNNEWTTGEITKSNSNLVICHHENDMKKYDHLDSRHKLVNISHCAEKTIFKDYGLEKEYDVLFVGIAVDIIYPLRMRLHNIIKKIPNHKILEHPGYKLTEDEANKQIINYAKEINKANVVVTCSSLYKYALAKYAEIPACRSFMVSDIPNEREDSFRKFIGEIHEDQSDSQILDIINFWIHDDERREEMTNIGYEYIYNNYTQEHYADRFIKAINKELQIY